VIVRLAARAEAERDRAIKNKQIFMESPLEIEAIPLLISTQPFTMKNPLTIMRFNQLF
jgi:hypothetical protein